MATTGYEPGHELPEDRPGRDPRPWVARRSFGQTGRCGRVAHRSQPGSRLHAALLVTGAARRRVSCFAPPARGHGPRRCSATRSTCVNGRTSRRWSSVCPSGPVFVVVRRSTWSWPPAGEPLADRLHQGPRSGHGVLAVGAHPEASPTQRLPSPRREPLAYPTFASSSTPTSAMRTASPASRFRRESLRSPAATTASRSRAPRRVGRAQVADRLRVECHRRATPVRVGRAGALSEGRGRGRGAVLAALQGRLGATRRSARRVGRTAGALPECADRVLRDAIARRGVDLSLPGGGAGLGRDRDRGGRSDRADDPRHAPAERSRLASATGSVRSDEPVIRGRSEGVGDRGGYAGVRPRSSYDRRSGRPGSRRIRVGPDDVAPRGGLPRRVASGAHVLLRSAAAAGAAAALADVARAGRTHLRPAGHAHRRVGRLALELLQQLGRRVDPRDLAG